MSMKRKKQVLVLVLLLLFLLGLQIPVSSARGTGGDEDQTNWRTIDVTVKPVQGDFWDWLAFNQGDGTLHYLLKYEVSIFAGAAKLQEAVLDKNNRSEHFNFKTDKAGAIKIKVTSVYEIPTGRRYTHELSYSGAGQVVLLEYVADKYKMKTLVLP